MSTDSRDFDRFTAERMLGGEPAVPPSSLDPLADLLAAASAPGREAELAGEEAAVAAFRAALSPHALSPQESRSNRLPFGRFFTAKVAAVAVAATAAGGVAVAATTGALPIPSVTDPGGPTTTVSPATSGSSRGTAAPTKGGNGTNPTSKPTPGTPQSTPAALCRTLASGSLKDGARALRSPAFAALVAAAGGAQNVPAYCQKVLKPGQAHGNGDKGNNGKGKGNNGKAGENGDNKGGDDTPKKDDDKGDGGGKGKGGGNGFGSGGDGGHGGHWHGPRWGDDSQGDGDDQRAPGTYDRPDRTPGQRPGHHGFRPGFHLPRIAPRVPHVPGTWQQQEQRRAEQPATKRHSAKRHSAKQQHRSAG
ncbi:hypothetical protein J4573_50070 [Actinomadura barringtoniae]|uniref:Uncharacterized protein n=1 Tax=Actinomadura barringtoniae TaxID=1427535 RepID=A0A939TGD1_9ACTN|nr:hypothetical protein [Actinomadura barringtoniae]MBO2455305.1 hypothetical protein [Actinomadura barringtoniae]